MRMMPQIPEVQKQELMTTTFRGYNHNEIIQDGELYDMQNLSVDKYPTLSARKKRGITCWDESGEEPVPLTGIYGRDKLVHIRGTDVYYGDELVVGISVSTDAGMLPKKMVSMGAYVCIFPDKKYFNTISLTDCGMMGRTMSIGGANVALTMCRNDGTDYDMTQITASTTPPQNPTNNQLWLDQSGEADVLRQYSANSQQWVEVPSVYVKISGTNVGQGISEYDVVEISGMELKAAGSGQTDDTKLRAQVAALNGSAIVYGAGTNYIIIAGLIYKAVAAGGLKTQNIELNRTIPDLDFVCESNNRLWGCRYGLQGSAFVNEIYASKLGDFKNWNIKMGLSSDSYTASVGSEGPFTGAVTQWGYPIFFKENVIHRISGQSPSSFQISTVACRGIQEGSWRSAVVVNEAIFYKSRTDVMMYDGNLPVSVSTEMGGVLYSDARAGAVNGKYFISMKSGNEWAQFCYDTKRGLWHREDATKALMYAAVDDELYYIDEENNSLVGVNGTIFDADYGAEEQDLEWQAVFGISGIEYRANQYGTGRADIRGHLYLSRFDFRMCLEEGATMDMWIEYDSSGIWTHQGVIRGRGVRSFVQPVIPRRCDHLRVKISGKGDFRIFSISRIMEAGADA